MSVISSAVEKVYQMDDSFRDSIATIDSEGKRKFIYPKKPSGKLYRLRTFTSLVFLLVFLITPFIRVEGEPFILIDALNRRFILFGQIFWPQDFFIFAVGFLTFMVFVILFTVAFGRLFCGWICPQTNFMEMVFRKIEYWIDGDATQQVRLKKLPWNAEKIKKRLLKISVFYLISVIIANFFLSYIIGSDRLINMMIEGIGKHTGTFFSLIGFATVFFFVYYWFREQACIVVCPYGRLQGVLLDKNSIVVAYDYVRGEPRQKLKKEVINENTGDCIDCNACVRVCPTGIDIRNGTQLECVNCTACIDACDSVMTNIHKPVGLIRYASENNISRKEVTGFTRRMWLYTTVLCVLVGILVVLLATRSDVDTRILRAQGLTYQRMEDGRISNVYNIKLANKTRKKIPLELKLENIRGELTLIQKIEVSEESYFQTSFLVKLNRENIKERKTPIEIGVYRDGKKLLTRKTTFIAPAL